MHRMHKKMHNMHKYADGYAKICTLCTRKKLQPAARIRTQVMAGQTLAAMAGH